MASGCKKKHSKQQQENYKQYEREMRWKKNREKSLKNHLSANPNDKAAEAALEKLSKATKPRHIRTTNGDVKKVDKPSLYLDPDIALARSIRKQLELR